MRKRIIGENKLFTEVELLKLGFKWIEDGGYHYMMLDNPDPTKVVVTEDLEKRDSSGVFKLYWVWDLGLTKSLTISEVSNLTVGGRRR